MRAGLVIVAEVLAEDALEVTRIEDENVVQKLPSHRAHPALGEGIHVGRQLHAVPSIGKASGSSIPSTH